MNNEETRNYEENENIGEVEVAAFCKPECWWLGGCPEPQSCGRCEPKEMPSIQKVLEENNNGRDNGD